MYCRTQSSGEAMMAQEGYGKWHYGLVDLKCKKCNKTFKQLSQSYGYLDKMGFCIWCAGE